MTNDTYVTISVASLSSNIIYIKMTSSSDLSGTYIVSDKPIAVFSGNVRTEVDRDFVKGDRSHLVEQVPPINTWGTSFYPSPIPNRTTGDLFKVMASEANTTVQVCTYASSGSHSIM